MFLAAYCLSVVFFVFSTITEKWLFVQSSSLLLYLRPPEQLSALQTIRKMSTLPSYDEFVVEVRKLMSEASTLQRQV